MEAVSWIPTDSAWPQLLLATQILYLQNFSFVYLGLYINLTMLAFFVQHENRLEAFTNVINLNNLQI